MEDAVDHWAIDRVEGGWAHLTSAGADLLLPASWLPPGAGEADVLRLRRRGDGGAIVLRLEVDRDETRRRLRSARRAKDALPRGPSGDVDL